MLEENNQINLSAKEEKSIILRENQQKDVILSIVIPTYKRARYLCDAISSAVEQMKVPSFVYEIVVINNDPSDNMEDTIKRFANDNVTFYKNAKNYGQVGNINQGSRLAKGKYIAFLHDDDLLFPNYIKTVSEYLTSLDFDCLIPSYYNFYEQYRLDLKHKVANLLTAYRLIRCRKVQKILPEDYIFSFYDIYNAPTCGVIFKKEALEQFGYFKDERGAAWDYYNFREFNKDHTIYLLHAFLGARRMYSGMSNSKRVQEDFLNDKIHLLEELSTHDFIGKYKDSILTRKPLWKYAIFKVRKELYIHNRNLIGNKMIPLYRWCQLNNKFGINLKGGSQK